MRSSEQITVGALAIKEITVEGGFFGLFLSAISRVIDSPLLPRFNEIQLLSSNCLLL